MGSSLVILNIQSVEDEEYPLQSSEVDFQENTVKGSHHGLVKAPCHKHVASTQMSEDLDCGCARGYRSEGHPSCTQFREEQLGLLPGER